MLMLVWCSAIVFGYVSASKQHCFNILYLLESGHGENTLELRCLYQPTQNIYITFIQWWTNVGSTLHKCDTNVLCLLG